MMTQFNFLARNSQGKLTRGVQTAESSQALRCTLLASGLTLVSFTASESSTISTSRAPDANTKQAARADAERALATSATPRLDFIGQSVIASLHPLLKIGLCPSSRSIEIALKQLAMMLRSGLDLRSALTVTAAQSTSYRLRIAIVRVIALLESGRSFSQSLEQSGVFPPIVTQLVSVGEASGSLNEVLDRAESYLAQRRENVSAVRLALAYPTVVAIAAMTIAVYLTIVVIPQLQKFLLAMGRKLPRITQSLIDLSQWCQQNLTGILVALTVLIGLLVIMTQWLPARRQLDRWLLRIPLVGGILQLSGTLSLASSLEVMLRSGLKLVDSLSVSQRLLGNYYLQSTVAEACKQVVRGQSLSGALATPATFVPMLGSMLEVAQRTGQLDHALHEVTVYCSIELQTRVKRLSMLMEPAIILVAGGIVGYVYIAFFMGMMSAGGSMR